MEQSFTAFLFESPDKVQYETAWQWQKDWQKKLFAEPNSSQAVWLLEHLPCYTLGRGANEKNILFDLDNPPVALHRVDRGGEVTFHLPGQLVAYPVLDLRRYKTDLDWYLRQLEAVVLDVLNLLELPGEKTPGLTGLWIEGRKVAAIGVGCRRWITQHGLALNVDCDLGGFSQVIPCGLKGYQVGKLNDWLPGLKVSEVKPLMRDCLSNRFGLIWENSESPKKQQ